MRTQLADPPERSIRPETLSADGSQRSSGARIPVLHFLNAVAESSITSMVADQIRSFDADRYEWHVIGLRGVETTSPFDGHDVTVVDFQESASGFARLRRDLKDYIRRHNIQLVHTHTPRATVIVSLTLGYPRRAKLVTTKHSPVATERASLEWLFTMVDRAATYAPDHLIAVSSDLGSRILSLPGVSQERVTVIPNAVDVAKYDVPQERAGCRDEFGIAADAPLIGFAGRLTHVKRIDLLLEAFRIVRERFPASRLLIAGDGEEMEAKRVCSRELGVESAVIWTGHRQDIERLFSAMDVYVQKFDSRRTFAKPAAGDGHQNARRRDRRRGNERDRKRSNRSTDPARLFRHDRRRDYRCSK